MNGASSFPAGLFGGALLADTELRLGFFSAALIFTGNGLNMEARFAFFRINTKFVGYCCQTNKFSNA